MAFSSSYYELEIDSIRRGTNSISNTNFYLDLPFSIPQGARQIQLGVVYISDAFTSPSDNHKKTRLYIVLEEFEGKVILPHLWPSRKITFSVDMGEKVSHGNKSYHKFIAQDDQHQTLKISPGSSKISRLNVRLIDCDGLDVVMPNGHDWKFILRIEREDTLYFI